MAFRRPFVLSPWRVIIVGLVTTTIIGALLLSLPWAQKTPHTIADLIFTSATATSVTGILTVPLDSFTLFGKFVILLLVQIGALGLLTFIVPLIGLFFNIGMRTHLITGHQFELENWSYNWISSKRIIIFIVSLTLIVEAIGSLLFYFMIDPKTLTDPRWFTALFFGVSSFCNSGISPFPGDDMSTVQHNMPLLGLSTILMVVGSFGFIPLYELFHRFKLWLSGSPQQSLHLTLHSKIILYFAPLVTMIFAPLLWFFERAQFAGMGIGETLNVVMFNTVSLRSCGFTTLNLTLMIPTTLLLILIFAFIGSSPGSVAGGTGIRITAFILTLATIRTAVTGKSDVELFKRRIPNEQIIRAFAVFATSIMWCILSTLLLLITEQGSQHPFLHFLFEAVSAFANHGVSLGLAPTLSAAGKIIIAISMIYGRISALTLILAIRKHKEKSEIQYPEENVLLV